MSYVEKVSAEGALIHIGLSEKKFIARELNAPSNFWEATRKIKNTIGLVQPDAQSDIHEFNREITKSSWSDDTMVQVKTGNSVDQLKE